MSFATAALIYGYYLGTAADVDATDPHGLDGLADETLHAMLLAAAGFTDQWTKATADPWFDRFSAAARFVDLAVLSTELWDEQHLFLTAAYITTNGDPGNVIALGDLPPTTVHMRNRLRWALDVLGYEPAEPQWMLASIEHDLQPSPPTGRIADRTPNEN